MSSSEQICGRSSNRPSAPLSGISTSTTRPTSVIAGSWPTLMHDPVHRRAGSDHEHPSRRERVQEVAQEHAPDGDDHDADDDRRHELGGVGLGHAEETVEERAEGQGQDAATADAEAELAHLEEGARLEATARGPVDAADGQGDHDRHREERVHSEVVDQVRPDRSPPRVEMWEKMISASGRAMQAQTKSLQTCMSESSRSETLR